MPIGIHIHSWYIHVYANRLLHIHVYNMYMAYRYTLYPMRSYVYPMFSYLYPIFSSAFFRLKTVYIHR